jgi:uncharacterized membrane protein (DUF485 family)
MKSHSKRKAAIGIPLGVALIVTAAALTNWHLIPNRWGLISVLVGLVIYLWGCAALAKAKGYTAAQGVFIGLTLTVLLLLVLPDRTKMSKAQRDEEDREDAKEEKARQAAMRRPLKGAKKAFAWLLGLFFFTLGVAIVVGYEIYWARVVVPERKSLATAISVSSDKLDPQNDGKLIYVVGKLAGAEKLTDSEFGVAVDALRLRRRVWMYQWEQGGVRSKSSYGVEDSHGNTTTLLKTRTYNYSKNWSEKVIDSRSFYDAGHDNPATKEIPDRTVAAAKITLGVFTVAPELVEQIDSFQAMPVNDKNLSAIAEPLRTKAKLAGDEIYFGTNADQPAIGDLKVKFESAPPATASVIARQNGNNLSPYQVANAGSVALLRVGTYSVPEIVAQFAKTNSQGRVLVWVAGCVLILFGGLLIKIARRR